ncbi:hypothetical protein SpAn4DRAFT_0035 [Sporomusa ovata]|uniref:Uncharacterized protein n=1 Tax=Sporomusa ovata TaxID=2378 RepID=A0A0U1L359_9FIRM|nr:hypothetical protein SpAn4DRAFT_0035 [Sporomusa ovata]
MNKNDLVFLQHCQFEDADFENIIIFLHFLYAWHAIYLAYFVCHAYNNTKANR